MYTHLDNSTLFLKRTALPQRCYYRHTKRLALTLTISRMIVLTYDGKPIDASNVRHHRSLMI